MAESAHDRKVRKIARDLKKNNWNVQADVSNYATPDAIGKGNYIPDIFATKKGNIKIIEVDTPGTEDPKQLSTFKRSAAQRKRANFIHVITKPKKNK